MADSLPPHSESRQARPLERFRPALRGYHTDPRLEQVWRRLEKRRGGARRGQTLLVLAVAAVSAGFGYVSGRVGYLADTRGEGVKASTSVWNADHESITRPEVPSGIPASMRAGDQALPRAEVPHEAAAASRASLTRNRARAVTEVSPLSALAIEPREPGPEVEVVAPAPRASWSDLAEQGEYSRAFQALDESGRLADVVAHGGPEDLMTLAEVARFAGRTGWAIQALQEVTTRHSADANAPIAAMMLGNLLSRAGDSLGASRAFALNRQLSPKGDFAEDALLREFFAAAVSMDWERAQLLLHEYEQKFPAGERLDEMREALSPELPSDTRQDSKDELEADESLLELEAELAPE